MQPQDFACFAMGFWRKILLMPTPRPVPLAPRSRPTTRTAERRELHIGERENGPTMRWRGRHHPGSSRRSKPEVRGALLLLPEGGGWTLGGVLRAMPTRLCDGAITIPRSSRRQEDSPTPSWASSAALVAPQAMLARIAWRPDRPPFGRGGFPVARRIPSSPAALVARNGE
jgi:hypothetical protein